MWTGNLLRAMELTFFDSWCFSSFVLAKYKPIIRASSLPFLGGTNSDSFSKPLKISGVPPTVVEITGNPEAKASNRTRPSGS